MISIKKPEEIKIILKGGNLLARILRDLAAAAKPGVSTADLNKMAEDKIQEVGGEPSFRGYGEPAYPAAICASINNEVVHGIPSAQRILQQGDILSIDIGMCYPRNTGFYTDHAITIPIGEIDKKAARLIKVTRSALYKGIMEARVGNYISDIGKTIQNYVETEGFSVVKSLVGHGVGYDVHEEPQIPNYFNSKMPKIKIKEGMVLAIEPMVNEGDYLIKTKDDHWTVETADGKLSAHFEHTVIVTKNGPVIATK